MGDRHLVGQLSPGLYTLHTLDAFPYKLQLNPGELKQLKPSSKKVISVLFQLY